MRKALSERIEHQQQIVSDTYQKLKEAIRQKSSEAIESADMTYQFELGRLKGLNEAVELLQGSLI